MKKRKKLKLFLLFAAGLTVGALILSITSGFWLIPFRGVKYPEFHEAPDFQRILTPEEMREDLAQLQRDLAEVHPATLIGMPERLKIAFAQAESEAKENMTVGEFSVIAAALTCQMDDAHTAVALGRGGRPLPATIKIIDEHLYILDGVGFEPGDEILTIGGVGVGAILEFAKKVISAENDYCRGRRLEKILNQSVLAQIGAQIDEKRNIELGVFRNGEKISILTNFGYTPPAQTQNPEYSYRLDEATKSCVFTLRSCNYNNEYIQFLATMFQDIHAQGIENIIVDLRDNPGGDSRVVEEFLRYIDVIEYKGFSGSRRMSKAASEQRGYILKRGLYSGKPSIIKNNLVEGPLFKGKILALINNGTFSSGNFFAIILVDNGISKTIGEPTGNAPSSYGDVLYFQLKNSKLFYQISYTQFIRPSGRTDEVALFPDYPVARTIDDYINQRDPAMEEAMRLIREGQ